MFGPVNTLCLAYFGTFFGAFLLARKEETKRLIHTVMGFGFAGVVSVAGYAWLYSVIALDNWVITDAPTTLGFEKDSIRVWFMWYAVFSGAMNIIVPDWVHLVHHIAILAMVYADVGRWVGISSWVETSTLWVNAIQIMDHFKWNTSRVKVIFMINFMMCRTLTSIPYLVSETIRHLSERTNWAYMISISACALILVPLHLFWSYKMGRYVVRTALKARSNNV